MSGAPATCFVAALVLQFGAGGARAGPAAADAAAQTLAAPPYAAPFLPPPKPIARGLELSGHLDMETVSVVSGGLSNAAVPTAVLEVGGALDTAAAGLWPGGRWELGLMGIQTGGNLPEATGAVQVSSNIWAEDAFLLSRLSYRQTMGPAYLQVGIMDVNYYFDTTPVAGQLANSSFGISPTITSNAPISTFPDAGLGFMGGVECGGGWTALAGVWQGNPATTSNVERDGAMYVGEVQRRWKGQADDKPVAVLKLGAWHYASSNPELGPSTGGGYGIAEARLRSRGPLEVAVFLQGGASTAQVNPVPYYLGVGTRVIGMFADRSEDTLSLGIARAWLRGLHPETVWEANYSVQLYRGIYVQPDLQWIQNPGGNNPDALMVGLRVHLEM
jgi:porin